MKRINMDAAVLEPITGHTSKGDQPKWQVRGKWYKADHMGHEALSEILVSALLAKSNVKDFVTYYPILIEYHEKELRGCVSDNFRRKDEMLIPFERLHRAFNGKGLAESIGALPTVTERIQYTVDFVQRTTGLVGVGPYLTAMLELDAFFLNEDRHTNNLAVIRNEDTGRFRLCPIFDNGLALLSDVNDYPLDVDIYACLGKVRAKPFSTNFDEQAECAGQLYGSRLKFTFTRRNVTELLDSLADFYPEDILRRTEQLVFEQMRRYSIKRGHPAGPFARASSGTDLPGI